MLFDKSSVASNGMAMPRNVNPRASIRRAIFANPYYQVWGASGEPPLPVYEVTFGRAVTGIGRTFLFQDAANRAIDAASDLRWGSDRRGFRRILHPNGVCLTGVWEIDTTPAGTAYTGYFQKGSRVILSIVESSLPEGWPRAFIRSLR
jgi:hypothetical protein